MIHKKISSVALTVGLLGLSSAAVADNVITFNGEVSDQTCDPKFGNGDLTVNLDPATPSELYGLNSAVLESKIKPFNIELKNCPFFAKTVTVQLSSDNADSFTGNLYDSNYGRNVQIRVQNADGSNLRVNSSFSSSTPAEIQEGGTATIPLQAAYYVVSGPLVRPGQIVAQATYTLRTQ